MNKSTSLTSVLIDGLVKPTSPDMVWLAQVALKVMDDPKQPGLIKFGAFLAGSFAIGQTASDLHNRAYGMPREWICGPNKPPREQFVADLQQALLFKLPQAKNIFTTPQPRSILPSRISKKTSSKRLRHRRPTHPMLLTQSTLRTL